MNSGPPEKAPLPSWARALRMRRVELGKSQERVALDSGILNQTTVSELEGAKYEVGNLTTARIAGLARGLNWTLAELEEGLGIDFGLSALEASPRASSSPLPPVVPHRPLPLNIPDELQVVIDNYGDTYPQLRDETMQRILTAPRNFGGPDNGPQTAEEWLEWFLLSRRYLR